MSYCNPKWTSDYTYSEILQWRRSDPWARPESDAISIAAGHDTDGLLLWGRIRSDDATLNPAFFLTTLPVLPETQGENELRGIARDGTVLFRISFAGVPVADGDDPDERHFAYFVPISREDVERVDRIELVTPRVRAVRRASALPGAGAMETTPELRMESHLGDRARIQWDSDRFPMVMVRDSQTGHVLSIGQGGEVEFTSGAWAADRLEIIVSDGVRSRVGTAK